MTRTLLRLAGAWTIIGLAGGVYYRTMTHLHGFEGATQLAVVHTHALALGVGLSLLLMVIDKVFGLGSKAVFRWGVGLVTVGLGITVGSMLLRGSWQVLGNATDAAWLNGVSGLGHITIAAAIVALALAMRGLGRTVAPTA